MVAKLGSATFEVADLDGLADYYTTTLGFTETRRDADVVHLTSGVDHHNVVLRKGSEDGIRAIGWQLAPDADLDAVAARLRDNGVDAEVRSDGVAGIARHVAFTDPEGNDGLLYTAIEQVAAGFREHGIRPNKLGHICLRATDVQRLTEWYETALGFRWSDWMGDFFVFLRCNSDHHALNLLRGERSGNVLHHIAYELEDFAAVAPACDLLHKRGLPLVWGPGRHGPGHNIFTYHRDPAGHVVELFCQLDVMDEALGCFEPRPWHEDVPQRPKVWTPGPLAPNSWGITPPENFI